MSKTKHISLALVFFIAALTQAFAQDARLAPPGTNAEARYYKPRHTFSSYDCPAGEAAAYLGAQLPTLSRTDVGLGLAADLKSPGGRHLTFVQTYKEVPVVSKTIKVNIAKSGKLVSVLDNSVMINGAAGEDFAADFAALSATVRDESGGEIWRADSVYDYDPATQRVRAAYVIETILETDGKGRTYIYEASDGARIRASERSSNRAQGHTGKGRVFAPDPLTSACVEYDQNSLYHDNNDMNSPFFENQYLEVDLEELEMNGGKYQLSGPYVRIQDLRSPTVLPVASLDGNFFYDRSEDGFEQVNTYYHIHEFKSRINKLGFSSLADYPIMADAQGTEADNSFFTPAAERSYLIFGTGGVDDAEDADVIVHEYAHALSASGSPGTMQGYERKALDEGICDFFAAAWSRGASECRWADVFTWDGHNVHWPGRSARARMIYNDGDLDRRKVFHEHGQIWSSALMGLWDIIGREKTETLQLQQLYFNNNNMTLRDAAYTLLDADEMLYNGAHSAEITSALCRYDLLPAADCGPASIDDESFFAEFGFKFYPNPAFDRLFVEFSSFDAEAEIKIFDITGELYYFSDLNSYKNSLDLSELPAGIYIGEVEDSEGRVRFKFIKTAN